MTEATETGNNHQVYAALEAMEHADDPSEYAKLCWEGLTGAEQEQLNQLLHQGPVSDGNVVSKSARDSLVEYQLAARCCFMGTDGYTVATYEALSVFKEGGATAFDTKPGIVQ